MTRERDSSGAASSETGSPCADGRAPASGSTTGSHLHSDANSNSGIAGPPWSLDVATIQAQLKVGPGGLSSAEAQLRLRTDGPNQLRSREATPAWRIVLSRFKSPIVGLLGLAAGVSYAFGEWLDGTAVASVLIVNAAIGFVVELRAQRSMEALRRLTVTQTRVHRDGQELAVPSAELVRGDVVVGEAGDVINADLRIIEASRLEVDESLLTGESVPVAKSASSVPPEATIDSRTSMLFSGTAITRGSMTAIVVGTGSGTELGRIGALVESAEGEVTPLELRLQRLGTRVIYITVLIAILPVVLGLLRGEPLLRLVKTGLALAVAAIPEGLPVVATIALARGMWQLSRRSVLVRRLSAVESLGSVNTIFTDKTGTLTENRMTVRELWLADRVVKLVDGTAVEDGRARLALEIGLLCNNATIDSEGTALGDPLEVALVRAAAGHGLSSEALEKERPRDHEIAFDAVRRRMATVHEQTADAEGRKGHAYWIAVKGAPESVLEASSSFESSDGPVPLTADSRAEWLERNTQLASTGARVLAVAYREADNSGDHAQQAIDHELILVALVALSDPPRTGVADAVSECQRAGIRVVMLTGDQAATARAIGLATGVIDDPEARVVEGRELGGESDADSSSTAEVAIFARVDPEQKLRLIAQHQARGAVVAMTGDGVNDAPALRKADIGVAMGQRGTEVAREASDVVLEDDSFASIVAAIRGGRIIFRNIRRFVFYLLSCNLSEVTLVCGALALGSKLPLLPIQILFLNLVTDVFPALALAFGQGDGSTMDRPPRPKTEAILTRRLWFAVGGYGLTLAASVLAAFLFAEHSLHYDDAGAVTVSFLTLGFAQLWHVYNLRSPHEPFFGSDLAQNRWLGGALLLCTGLLLVANLFAPLAHVLGLTSIGREGWLTVFGFSIVPCVVGDVVRAIRRR